MVDFREIGQRLSNWGRWGDDDQRGTVNFITAEKVAAAGQLIRTGKVFDLGIPFGAGGPQPGRRPHQPGAARVGDRNGPGFPRRVPLCRRLHLHAAAGGVAMGRPGPRLLRRQALQRLPVVERDVSWRAQVLDHRDGQGHHRPRRAARHRPPEGRGVARAGLRHHARGPRRRRRRRRRGGRVRRHPPVPHRLAPQVHPGAGSRGIHGRRARPRLGQRRMARPARGGGGVLGQLGHRGTARGDRRGAAPRPHDSHPGHGHDPRRDPRLRRAVGRLRRRRRVRVLLLRAAHQVPPRPSARRSTPWRSSSRCRAGNRTPRPKDASPGTADDGHAVLDGSGGR